MNRPDMWAHHDRDRRLPYGRLLPGVAGREDPGALVTEITASNAARTAFGVHIGVGQHGWSGTRGAGRWVLSAAQNTPGPTAPVGRAAL